MATDPLSGMSAAISRAGITGPDTGARTIPVLQDGGTKGTSFADTLTRLVNQVSSQQDVASDYAARFTRGEPVELHQVMASAEEASLSLEMLVQVRNKFLAAYSTVMNMQS